VAPCRGATGRGWMFFVWGMHRRRLMGLLVIALAAVLVSSCGKGGGQEDDSAAGSHAKGGCPKERPTMKDGAQNIPCDIPASRIFKALAEALGEPAPAASQ
jgi:hypothetical protein